MNSASPSFVEGPPWPHTRGRSLLSAVAARGHAAVTLRRLDVARGHMAVTLGRPGERGAVVAMLDAVDHDRDAEVDNDAFPYHLGTLLEGVQDEGFTAFPMLLLQQAAPVVAVSFAGARCAVVCADGAVSLWAFSPGDARWDLAHRFAVPVPEGGAVAAAALEDAMLLTVETAPLDAPNELCVRELRLSPQGELAVGAAARLPVGDAHRLLPGGWCAGAEALVHVDLRGRAGAETRRVALAEPSVAAPCGDGDVAVLGASGALRISSDLGDAVLLQGFPGLAALHERDALAVPHAHVAVLLLRAGNCWVYDAGSGAPLYDVELPARAAAAPWARLWRAPGALGVVAPTGLWTLRLPAARDLVARVAAALEEAGAPPLQRLARLERLCRGPATEMAFAPFVPELLGHLKHSRGPDRERWGGVLARVSPVLVAAALGRPTPELADTLADARLGEGAVLAGRAAHAAPEVLELAPLIEEWVAAHEARQREWPAVASAPAPAVARTPAAPSKPPSKGPGAAVARSLPPLTVGRGVADFGDAAAELAALERELGLDEWRAGGMGAALPAAVSHHVFASELPAFALLCRLYYALEPEAVLRLVRALGALAGGPAARAAHHRRALAAVAPPPRVAATGLEPFRAGAFADEAPATLAARYGVHVSLRVGAGQALEAARMRLALGQLPEAIAIARDEPDDCLRAAAFDLLLEHLLRHDRVDCVPLLAQLAPPGLALVHVTSLARGGVVGGGPTAGTLRAVVEGLGLS